MDSFIDLLRHGETTSTAGLGTDGTCHHRCARFAQHLATQLQVPLHLNAAFRERDFGAWEGLTAAELPPGGKTPLASLRQRLKPSLPFAPATLTRLRLAAGGQPSLVFHRN